MDLGHDRARIMAEEDRISNLPDDIIYHILSFLDMKYAVQTSTLSKKWKLIWTSIPHLNLNSYTFRTLPMFAKFVKHVLSCRNNLTEVSAVELTFTGAVTQFFVRSIVNYAYSHNVRQMTIIYSTRKFHEFPQCLISSHTLKHLTIATNQQFYLYSPCCIPTSAWDFPALETLNLSNMRIGNSRDTSLNLFSKCVNLKNLTLHQFSMLGLEVFNVCAPQLSNLTITDAFVFPKVFNVVAPQLENLTASVSCAKNAVTSSFLGSSVGEAYRTLQLSTGGFNSLDKVNLSLLSSYKKEEEFPLLLDLFQKLRSAKFLILNVDIIETLSSCLDQLSVEPCPFNNLRCLKIDTALQKQTDRVATIPTQVKNYLLENSPCATFIMELPQEPPKRSRHQIHKAALAKKAAKLEAEQQQRETMAREKTMLEAKIQMQDEAIAKQKVMLEALQLQHERLMSHIIKSKMAELQVQVESGNPDYELIRSMGRDVKSVINLIPQSFRLATQAQFASQYEEVRRMLRSHLDASQWAKIETELRNVSPSQRTLSNNFQSQSDVRAAELPQAPGLSSAKDMPTSSSVALLGSNMVVRPSQSSRE